VALDHGETTETAGTSVTSGEASTKTHRIFVYGSLRRGEHNHKKWFGDGATPVLDGHIRGAELVSLGAYCCIVPTSDPTCVVVGEVYDLTPEVFEGIEVMEKEAGYVRQPVHVYAAGGTAIDPVRAEAYFFGRPDRIAKRPRVASGDWRTRTRPRA
jgi:gamma-glutamylcyclotransferase (GGCT)/AIG2-like uncharacterized protein YtfP